MLNCFAAVVVDDVFEVEGLVLARKEVVEEHEQDNTEKRKK